MIDFETLIVIISKEFDLPPERLVAKSRFMIYVRPRWLAMVIYSEVHSMSETAKTFGKVSHGTISHARWRIREELDANPEFKAKSAAVMRKVKELSCYPENSVRFSPDDSQNQPEK